MIDAIVPPHPTQLSPTPTNALHDLCPAITMAYKRTRAPSPSDTQKRSRRGPSKYVFLGTELPEEEADDGAFVPVWKQTVTDERGRRRLHGAFTGGFSAG